MDTTLLPCRTATQATTWEPTRPEGILPRDPKVVLTIAAVAEAAVAEEEDRNTQRTARSSK